MDQPVALVETRMAEGSKLSSARALPVAIAVPVCRLTVDEIGNLRD